MSDQFSFLGDLVGKKHLFGVKTNIKTLPCWESNYDILF